MSDDHLANTNELSRPASSRLVHKALQQADRGDLAAAAKTLQRAVDLDPHPAALERLGDIWVRLNQPERAIIPLAAAVTLDPNGGAPSALAHVFMRLRRERVWELMKRYAARVGAPFNPRIPVQYTDDG